MGFISGHRTSAWFILWLVISGMGAFAADNPPPGIDSFLLPNGLVDVDALRASGYEGGVNFAGYRLAPMADKSARSAWPEKISGDENWIGDFPNPFIGGVVDACVWDGALVVASYADICRWTGSDWQSLAAGVNGGISCVASHGGDLIIGGDFTLAGGQAANRVARYDGSQWHALGFGVDDRVESLAAFGSQLIAAGDFGVAGTGYARHIAAWSGSDWSPLGDGLNEDVNDLVEYDGRLIAGGYFTSAGTRIVNHIAAWDGVSWTGLQNGTSGSVESLTVHDGLLVAAGGFVSAGTTAASAVAAWNGMNWSALGDGADWSSDYGGRLVASIGGTLYLSVSGGPYPGELLRWDSGTWTNLIENDDGYYGIAALVDFGGLLALGFAGYDDGATVFTYDGSAFTPLVSPGITGDISASATWNGNLVVAGDFWQAGQVAARGIARWDGADWHPFGAGLPEGSVVNAMTVHDGDLIVGGRFEAIGGVAAANIARWDGAVWSPMGAGLGAWDSGESVDALLSSGGTLFAGGDFDNSGGSAVSGLVCWSGDDWSDLAVGYYARVFALAEYGTGMAVGGYNISGLGGFAILDGDGYRTLGSGVGGAVTSIVDFRGGIVLGLENYNGSGYAIIRWDGVAWRRIDAPVGEYSYGAFSSLAVYDERLYAAGYFDAIGGVVAANIAAWNGTDWDNLGSGVYGGWSGEVVQTLTVTPWGLAVGGNFDTAGGKPLHNLALWVEPLDGVPVIPLAGRSLMLEQNAPNPFNPLTTIRFDLPGGGPVRLSVYDVAGRLIRTLVDTVLPAGNHQAVWDGRDGAGRGVGSGSYLARLEAGGVVETVGMSLLR